MCIRDRSSSVALTLLGPLTGAGTSLLQTLTGSNGTTPTDPLLALRLAEKNRTKEIERTAKEPETLRDIRAFTKAHGKAKTVDQALSDPAVLKVLLTANGLADQLAYPALAKKVLLSDPADPVSYTHLDVYKRQDHLHRLPRGGCHRRRRGLCRGPAGAFRRGRAVQRLSLIHI